MRPEDVARLGYRALAAGRPLVVAGAMNRLIALASRYAPHLITLPLSDLLMAED
jgi:hypothetical protein